MGASESDSSASASEAQSDSNGGGANPLELFFDLVFVFAFTRITAVLSHNLTWTGVLRGVALLALLWWAWVTYSWLTTTTPANIVLSERVVVLAAAAVMFVVALAVPGAFGDTAVLFGVAYFAVRALHVGLSVVAADDPTRDRFLRLVPGFLGGPALIVAAGFVTHPLQSALWVVGIGIDYGVLFVRGVAKYDVRPEHFVERYRDIVIIALGESILAMGFGIAGSEPTLPFTVVVAALLGIVLVAALAWLYFDYVTFAAEERFTEAKGYERGVLARNSYAYLHLPIIVGVIFVAFGLEETVIHVWEPLGTIPAVALCGGTALYLFGHAAFRLYDIGSLSVLRLVAAVVAVALTALAVRVPAIAAVAAVTTLLVGVVAFETAYSPIRKNVREE